MQQSRILITLLSVVLLGHMLLNIDLCLFSRLASTPAMFNSTLTEDESFLCPADGAIMITGILLISIFITSSFSLNSSHHLVILFHFVLHMVLCFYFEQQAIFLTTGTVSSSLPVMEGLGRLISKTFWSELQIFTRTFLMKIWGNHKEKFLLLKRLTTWQYTPPVL